MANVEAPPEDRYVLPRGQNQVPAVDWEADTPCRNEEVSARRKPDGSAMDLWAGEGYGRGKRKEAYEEAAILCMTVCRQYFPEAFEACRRYGETVGDDWMVYGGVLPKAYQN